MSIKALQEYTRISKYARFNEEMGRRETWNEQIDRVIDMHKQHFGEGVENIKEELKSLENALKKKEILGSQRALQFGGKAILNKHARMYNCSASYCDRVKFFQESMFQLLCGVGIGFSVQKHHIDKLPSIAKPDSNIEATFVIPDTIEGWADSIGILLSSYFVEDQSYPQAFGKKIIFDYSEIRPKGMRISNTNGLAPGPKPLKKAIEKIRNILDYILYIGNNRLRPIDAYDIIMHISDSVISGGVRRSATICLFSPDDEEMINAKTGNWFIENPQRGRSNNSVVLIKDETTKKDFDRIFKSVKEFGEPGFIFVDHKDVLVNPCAEIGLWAYDEDGNSGWAFCNLSEVNAKKARTEEDFYNACRNASIAGTLQATYTNFPYLGEVTERIVKREALIGVSITGIQDNPMIALNPEILRKGAEIVKETNKNLAKKIGINQSARTTTIKPSGTASAILGTSSGIHPQHAKRYIRRVQANKNEETLQFFEIYNPKAVEDSLWSANKTDKVISFLCEVPKSARTKNTVSAIDLLNDVKNVMENWIEVGTNVEQCVKPFLRHNVSNTISVRDDEWDEVENFIYENRKLFTGISLLPISGDKDYVQAPFQSVYTPKELIEMYGDASLFASGVIVHAKRAFGNIYNACDSILGIGEKILDKLDMTIFEDDKVEVVKVKIEEYVEKKKWIDRARKFTKRYFDNDLRKMTYCLKDVDAWKTWVDLSREYVDVPWESLMEASDNTKVSETIACAGGSCSLEGL